MFRGCGGGEPSSAERSRWLAVVRRVGARRLGGMIDGDEQIGGDECSYGGWVRCITAVSNIWFCMHDRVDERAHTMRTNGLVYELMQRTEV